MFQNNSKALNSILNQPVLSGFAVMNLSSGKELQRPVDSKSHRQLQRYRKKRCFISVYPFGYIWCSYYSRLSILVKVISTRRIGQGRAYYVREPILLQCSHTVESFSGSIITFNNNIILYY